MAITTEDLAALCKVSRGTIDRALNNRPGVSEKTRRMILDVAKERGYIPHLLASSLAKGKTGTVGMIVFDLNNQHFCQLIDGVEQVLTKAGIITYVCISEKDQEKEKKLLLDLAARRVDGILLTSVNRGEEFEEFVQKLSCPVIAITNLIGGIPYVGGDNFETTKKACGYFLERGVEYLHLVCPPLRNSAIENMGAQWERAQGYRSFMNENPNIEGGIILERDYWGRVREFIINAKGKSGFLCTSDIFAMDILRNARAEGLSAPRDFSLMGFDGLDMLEFLPQRINTIYYPAREIGIAAARLLLMDKDESIPQKTILPCSVLDGDTVRKLNTTI